MTQYAILSNPGHNRVYFEASKPLSLAELEAAASSFSAACGDFAVKETEGVSYVSFSSAEPLTASDLRLISRLSFVYAIFEEQNDGAGICLRPLRKTPPYYFVEDLSMILKYTGKTNELFTRMLINLAVSAGGYKAEDKLNLLDPVAGKGTTLYEALILGYNCAGIEISPSPVSESVAYLRRYLKTGHYKHEYEQFRISGEEKSFISEMNRFKIAKDKNSMKTGDTLLLEYVSGNSAYADRYFKKEQFHILAGDLPYGVQHGNISNEKQSSLTRNPSELLRLCLPAWKKTLRPGGIIALAWNSSVLARRDMEEIFLSEGLEPQNDPPYNSLEHRVDASIVRDILLCRKKQKPVLPVSGQ